MTIENEIDKIKQDLASKLLKVKNKKNFDPKKEKRKNLCDKTVSFIINNVPSDFTSFDLLLTMCEACGLMLGCSSSDDKPLSVVLDSYFPVIANIAEMTVQLRRLKQELGEGGEDV